MADKLRMNLVVTGHVDHGKSTGLGHTLFQLGQIHDPQKNRPPWRIAQQYFQESKNQGMGSWSYAWILDPLMDERARGLTINISFQEFTYGNYIFNLIDAPGHQDFVKNLITGASQADAAILVVSARTGEFEDGLKQKGTAGGKYTNVIGMTLEHMLLLISLGVTDIVVQVNKMDAVNWDKKRYDTIKTQITKTLTMLMGAIGIDNAAEIVGKIKFVPASGLYGINLLPKDLTISNLENHIKQAEAGKGDADFIESLKKELETVKEQWPDWYDGPSLLDALNDLPSPKVKQEKLAKQALRIPVQSVLNISGVGAVVTGRVASGILKPNMDVVVTPTKQTVDLVKLQVKTIQEFHKEIPQAAPGDNIGFNIKAKNIGANDFIRGCVVSDPKDPADVLLPGKDGFQALTLVVRSLAKKTKGKEKVWTLHKNYTPVIHIGTAQITCRVMEIKSLDGKDIEEVKQQERAMIWFTPTQPMVVEPASKSPVLGRFALRDSGKTVAVGIVEKIEKGRYEA